MTERLCEFVRHYTHDLVVFCDRPGTEIVNGDFFMLGRESDHYWCAEHARLLLVERALFDVMRVIDGPVDVSSGWRGIPAGTDNPAFMRARILLRGD